MSRLYKDTAAVLIHGKTGQEVETVTLPEGTRYRTVSVRFDPLGFAWKRINVKGYEYEIIG